MKYKSLSAHKVLENELIIAYQPIYHQQSALMIFSVSLNQLLYNSSDSE